MLGFRIPLAGFRIPKPWIPDSTDQNYLDSGFRITLHGAINFSQFWRVGGSVVVREKDWDTKGPGLTEKKFSKCLKNGRSEQLLVLKLAFLPYFTMF